ncbi:MAG: glycosyl transferase [Candidatus Eisenbacteria bacterium]|nr:glycosyl transferase [Candidatus Eisenbacteria bacterium]
MRQTSHFPPLDGRGERTPPARFLGNGRYTVLMTGAGTGRSSWEDYALTRWSGDPLEDDTGLLFYLRDEESGRFWSIGRHPLPSGAAGYRAEWEPGVVTIDRRQGGIDARMETCVPTGADLEIRRITLANRSVRERRLELTGYAEIVLDQPGAYAAHPAFSKLFVQTAHDSRTGALFARRRGRSGSERHPRMFAALSGAGKLEFETDRALFLGRGRSPADPLALSAGTPLSGSSGNVLDPVFALRRKALLRPGGEARFLFLMGVAPVEEDALALVRTWTDEGAAERAFAGSRERARGCIDDSELGEDRAEYYEALAGAILYGQRSLRAAPEVLECLRGRPEDLARFGLSPGTPYIVLRADSPEGALLLPEMRSALRYWKKSGIDFPLVVFTNDPSLAQSPEKPFDDGGTVHFIDRETIPAERADLLEAAARLVLTREMPDLCRGGAVEIVPPAGETAGKARHDAGGASVFPEGDGDLLFPNGFGGFTPDGSEYVIRLRPGADGKLRLPPLPWINVIANDRVGFLVSERGAGCTWSGNSREHRLTPWANDPLRDPHGEALYMRDEESGEFRSPLPGPADGPEECEVRHGFGYTLFRGKSLGIEQEVTFFVPTRDPVKITRVRLTNRSGETRRLGLFSHRRLVLGATPEESGRFVVTRFEPNGKALLAENRFAGSFARAVTFAAAVAPAATGPTYYSCDRAAFLGAGGDAARPAALLHDDPPGGETGANLDPCFTEKISIELPPGGSAECAFLFGEGSNAEEVRSLIARYRADGAVERALDVAREEWRRMRSGLCIRTPVPALDIMVNGWLPYQAVACRLRGRTALYQSGGAFGFRDQIQDASALVYLRPEKTREQILLHAAHQFVEGDVLHWWHPPEDAGIRTRFADDRLWLPYITTFYVETSGDDAVWRVPIPYLTAPLPAEGVDEVFVRPRPSGLSGDLYDHCVRAIDLSLAVGDHRLPLFGTGDWNDGMNRVGRLGKGESVWMGFFLFALLERFIPVCEERGDAERAARYRAAREGLGKALNDSGWDGDWYLRGFYDDGTPLGSRESAECRIDALAQAWSVLSGAAPPDRAERALDSAEKHLVSEKDGLIRLLTPPFADTPQDPGYIKGYLPGVRENGGQYTHAALWLVAALAERGRRGRAADLLEMLSPVTRAGSPEGVAVYRAEPYVIAADVYGEPPHLGRGGWTWYTGSAAWMYRVAVESILGLRLEGGKALRIRPRVPDEWPRCSVRFRVPGRETVYEIEMENPNRRAEKVTAAELDGRPLPVEKGSVRIPFDEDGQTHHVRIILG